MKTAISSKINRQRISNDDQEIIDKFIKDATEKLSEYPEFLEVLNIYAIYLKKYDPKNIIALQGKLDQLVSVAEKIGTYNQAPFSETNFETIQPSDCPKVLAFFDSGKSNFQISDDIRRILGIDNNDSIELDLKWKHKLFGEFKVKKSLSKEKLKPVLENETESKKVLEEFAQFLNEHLASLKDEVFYSKTRMTQGKKGSKEKVDVKIPSQRIREFLSEVISILSIHESKEINNNQIYLALDKLVGGFREKVNEVFIKGVHERKYRIMKLIFDFYNLYRKHAVLPPGYSNGEFTRVRGPNDDRTNTLVYKHPDV